MPLFRELTRLDQLQELMAAFYKAFHVTHGISDADGQWLVTEGWEDACTKFFRVHPEACEVCRRSDARLVSQLKPNVHTCRTCGHGLVDVGAPIVVNGEKVATFWLGQFFFQPPDREYYRRYAKQYGFPENEFLKAIAHCKVLARADVDRMMNYFIKFCEFLAEAGIQHHQRMKTEEAIRVLNANLEQTIISRTAELEKAKEAAEASNRAKSIFLATMSHELRTPLNAVLGFAQLMKVAPDATPRQLESLDIITRSGEHLLNLINNILDISKIESGRVLLEESATDLHQVLQEMRSLMYVKAKEKGLGFTVGQSPDFPHHVNVDAGKLRQVLINLIGNAVKYTKSGGVILQAGVAKWEAPQSARVRFEVKDSGPGIRAEDLERIFQPFVQLADQPVAEAGTGLGLTICKQYVELMGGQLGVTSEPGSGSVFHFEIPAAVFPAETMPAEPRHGRVVGLEEGQPRYRLLIVEDQPENRQLLSKQLEPFGFDVREASNGQEAVEIFEQWRPDLIWMDVRMPLMDGREATRRIKLTEAGARTKIIALTAHALEEERREILASGCDDFIRKPYRDSEVFDALARHLGLRFRYADEYPPAVEKKVCELKVDQLYKLPQELSDELLTAAELLDGPRILEAIDRISDRDHELGERLRCMAKNLQYKELLTALDSLAEKRAL